MHGKDIFARSGERQSGLHEGRNPDATNPEVPDDSIPYPSLDSADRRRRTLIYIATTNVL